MVAVALTAALPVCAALPANLQITNQAAVGFTDYTGQPQTRQSFPVVIAALGQADLAVSKGGPVSVNANSQYSYTITVTNTGPSTAVSVVVTDSLPANVTFISATGGGATNASLSNVFWTISNLSSGAVANLGLTVRAPASGVISNSVIVGSVTADTNLVNNSAGPVLTTVNGQADLAVSKSGPVSVAADNQFSYAISVTNNGPSPAISIVVTDSLPANVTFLSATGGGTTNSSLTNVFWTISNLSSGAVVNLGLTVLAPAGGVLSNSVVVGSATTDSNLVNNTAGPVLTTVIGQADLAVSKTGPASVPANSQFSYTIAVTNNGPSTAVSVVVTDSLPANVIFISANGGGTTNASLTNVFWTVSNLSSGAVVNLGLTVQALASGIISNAVIVGSATADTNLVNNTAGPVLTTVIGQADLAVSKTGPASVPANSQFSYTISVTNQGPSTAVSVAVTDSLPANVTFVSATGGGTTNASLTNVFWSVPSLASGTATNFGLTVQAPPTGVISNRVMVGSVTADSNLGNNYFGPVLTTVIGQADLAVSKSGPATVNANSQFSYTISVTNQGPSTAVSVVVTDSLPANVTFVSVTGGGTTDASLTNVFWTVSSLASGAATNFGLTVQAPASGVISNWVVTGSATADSNLGNNSAGPVLTTVNVFLPVPTLTKSTSATNVMAGAPVLFTLVAGNTGTTNAAAIPVFVSGVSTSLVIIRDAVPLKTTFVQFNSTGTGLPLYHHAGDPLQTYALTAPADLTQVDAIAVGYPTLPVGAAPTLTFTVLVNSNATGSIANLAQIEYANAAGGTVQTHDSNLVTLPISLISTPPTINYYFNNTYTQTAVVYRAAFPAYVQAACQSCIHNPGTIETATITITSQLTGDVENFPATETGPGTGLFRISFPTALAFGVGTPGNGTIETRSDDVLTATISGGGGSATAITQIMIDPNGVVFDSRNNQPVAGATVTLIDVTGQGNHKGTNQPALVFAGDGVTTNPATVTTGPDGTFQFLLVPDSTYKFVITPPKGYKFPSQVPSGSLSPTRVIGPAASYGGNFVVNSALGIVRWDVPVDPPVPVPSLTKSVTGTNVVLAGAPVQFTLVAGNTGLTNAAAIPVVVSGVTTALVIIRDAIPLQTKFVQFNNISNGTRLYHRTGDPLQTYMLTAPADLTQVDAIAVGYPTLPVGAAPTLTFTVLVNSNATGRITNTAQLDYANVAGSPAQQLDSNLVALNLNAPAPGRRLSIHKTVSTPEAEIGDVVTYTVQINNWSSMTITGVTLTDVLPAGFAYQRHSATAANGAALADPGKGPRLRFAIGNLASSNTFTLTYRTVIGVGALQGTGINSAQATGLNTLPSLVEHATVKVKPGVFTDQAFIIGKVFMDLNHNLIQDEGELGVPGVRIYMEDGTYVVTDSEGKYSIYGLSPRTHVLKVDEITLPPGARLEALTPRHNSRGVTCLADLKRGEMRKVNFAIASADPRILKDVQHRRAAVESEVAEIQQALTHELTAATAPLTASSGPAQPATGITSAGPLPLAAKPASESVSPVYQSMIDTVPLTSRNSLLPARPVAVVPRVDLEDALRGVSNELGFVDLKDHDTLPVAIVNVRVKGPAGAKFVLKLNGQLVAEQQVGKRLEDPQRRLAGWEYIGIGLPPGPNTLEVQQADPFGNVHSAKIMVTAPGNIGKIKIVLPAGEQFADGMTPVKVVVLVQDDQGVPVTARTIVTLDSSLGRWQVTDLNPDEPGVQTVIENGAAEFTLLPPQEPGDAKIMVNSGILRDSAVVPFLPSLRPMLAAGIIEGRLNLRNLNLNHVLASTAADGFEQELRNWSFGSGGGAVEGGGRVAMFLKGKIKGDYLLTLAYDSDKSSQTALFRDIQPDAFYPVYGDSGGRGFDAQSTGRLYIRVDKRKSYLLYGDFPTASPSEARSLGNYSRSLTGLKEHYEKANVVANAWGAFDSMKQMVKEFPADGTSGPYYFSNISAQENSEQVQIITRDRNQTNVVLKTVTMQRFVDYEFEPFSGQLLFAAPVPSLDSNLNPIFIRVTFEVDQGGKKFFVGGADAQIKLLPRWEVGGSVVRDENPKQPYQLYSANTTVKLFTNTFVLAELAQSGSTTNGDGNAGRVELRHETERTSARLYGAYVETNFVNPTAPINAGRQEVGAKLSQKLDKQTRLLLDVVDTKQLGTSNELWGLVGGIERTFSNKMTVEVGARYSQETTGTTASNSVTSVRTRVTMPVPLKPQAKLTGEYENDVLHPDRRMADLGVEYQAENHSRFYAKHEFINSVGSPYELTSSQSRNTTVIGVENEYMKGGNLFNEYRMNDGINGPDAVAAMGLRNGWNVAPGVKANTTFERTTPIAGTNAADVATAVGLGLEYTRNPDWKATGRVEYRTSDASDHWLNTLGYARKIDQDWTMLAKSILDVSTDKNLVATSNGVSHAGDKFQSRLQLGAAYRETRTDVWNALFLYEYKYEDLSGSASNDLRSAHIFTSHFNYQPAPELTLNGRLAFKFVNEDTSGVRNNSLAYLIGGRGMYDVTRRCSLGVNANAMFSGNLRSIQYGLGPDFGIRIHDNIWIDAGYNFIGFHDRDLSEGNYTEHGFFIGLRMQFDEHILDGLRRAKP